MGVRTIEDFLRKMLVDVEFIEDRAINNCVEGGALFIGQKCNGKGVGNARDDVCMEECPRVVG